LFIHEAISLLKLLLFKPDSNDSTKNYTIFNNKDVQNLGEDITNAEHKSVVVPADLPEKSKLQRFKDWIFNKSNKEDEITPSVDSIELINNSNPEAKPLKDKLYDQFFKEENKSKEEWLGNVPTKLSGLKDITGDSNKFNTESFDVLNEIEIFTDIKDSPQFTDNKIKSTIYDMLRDRLHKLSIANPDLFKVLVRNEVVQNKINDFVDLEKEIYPSDILQVAKSMNSDTYAEVALTTIEEQGHWSEKALSPKQDLLSPLHVSKEVPSDEISGSSKWNLITDKGLRIEVDNSLMEKYLNLDDKNRSAAETLGQSSNKVEDILNKADINEVAVNEDLKIVDWDRESSDDTAELINKYAKDIVEAHTPKSQPDLHPIDQFFTGPKLEFPKAEEVINPVGTVFKTETNHEGKLNLVETEKYFDEDSIAQKGFKLIKTGLIKDQLGNLVDTNKSKTERMSLMDQINARRNDKDVISTPNLSNVGLQTPIVERVNPSPLINKLGLSDLFESFNDL